MLNQFFRYTTAILILGLIACGGGGKSSGDGDGDGNFAVITTKPGHRAVGAAILDNITATLSDVINPTTVTSSSFTVTELGGASVDGQVSVIGEQLIFNPDAALRYSTIYLVTLSAAIADINGASLELEYQWQFNTGARLASGLNHNCVRFDNGKVKCWGENTYGQLGLGDSLNRGDDPGEMGDALPVVELGSGRSVLALSAGNRHSCALLDNGTVKCWGYNAFGELGLGDTLGRGGSAGDMGDALPTVELGNGRTALALTTGSSHNCALLDNGEIKCWGWNAWGELGQGDSVNRGDDPGEMGDALTVVDLGSERSALTLVSRGHHNCALLNNGTVKCWGYNLFGQLGLGDSLHRGDDADEMGDALPVVELGSGRRSMELTVGNIHSCALLDNGMVKCWGENSQGQLGLGDTLGRGGSAGDMGDALPTVELGNGRTALVLTTGSSHNCALLDNGTLKCWGFNYYGQLGIDDMVNRGDVVGEMGDALPVVNLGSGLMALTFAMGGYHSCALLNSGALKCWGENTHGQLGLGDTVRRGDTGAEMGDALPVVELGTP